MAPDVKMIIPAAFSIAGTSLVVLSYCLFKQLRKLRYVELVFYIALNDLIASSGVVLGNTPTGSIACNYQAFVSNYNYLCSVLWTTVVSYQLYSIIITGEGLVSMRYVHLFVWLFPLLVTLLPLTTNAYGTTDDATWCFITDRSNSPPYGILLWTILSFYLWLWICILTILAFYVIIYYKLHNLSASASHSATTALYRMSMYPGILIVCWITPTINDMRAAAVGYYAWPILSVVADITPAMQGFLLSVVFFRRNQAVLQEWYNLYSGSSQNSRLLGVSKSSGSSGSHGITPSSRSSNMTLTDSSVCNSRASDATNASRMSAEMATFDGRSTFSEDPSSDYSSSGVSEGVITAEALAARSGFRPTNRMMPTTFQEASRLSEV